MKDRLWFFGGARVERTTTANLFPQTGIPYTGRTTTALRGQADRHASRRADAAGHVHRQPHRSAQPSLARSIDPRDADDAVDDEPARRGDLARRDRRPHVRDGAVLAEELAGSRTTAARRRHPRLAVPDARHDVGRARPTWSTTARTSTRPIPTAQQPPGDGSVSYLLVVARARQPRAEVRRRVLRLDARRRQLADLDRLHLPDRLQARRGRPARARRQRPADPAVHAGHVSRLATWMPPRGAAIDITTASALRDRSLDRGARA